MKIKLFLATLCIFMLPLFVANSSGTSSQFSVYASGYVVAYGELIPCECDGSVPDCVCDGDTSAARISESNTANDSGKAPVSLGSEALFALASLMLWLRFKSH